MKQVSHPFTNDKPVLTQEYSHTGVWTYQVERTAKYRRAGSHYKVREPFATIRPAVNGGGFFSHCAGVVVTRNNFDEIRPFDTRDEAELYVKALFALEYGA